MSKMKRAGAKLGATAHSSIVHAEVVNKSVNYSIVLRDNHLWKDKGREVTVTVTSSTTFAHLCKIAAERFKYDRPIIVKLPEFNLPPSFNPASHPKSPKSSVISGYMPSFARLSDDQSDSERISGDAAFKNILKAWSSSLPSRRVARVNEIRDEIVCSMSSQKANERVLGLNRLWELIQRESNMHACEETVIFRLNECLKDNDWDVGEAAARVLWKMAQHAKFSRSIVCSEGEQQEQQQQEQQHQEQQLRIIH